MTAAASTANTFQLLTGAGPAAIASIALYGPRVAEFAARHLRPSGESPVDVRRATLLDERGEPLDELVVVRRAGGSLVLHLHGNAALVRRCLTLAAAAGFAAEESPRASFENLDELDCAAAALAPAMLTRRGLEWLAEQPGRLRTAAVELAALRDPHEVERRVAEIESRNRVVGWFTRPLRVAVVGAPNVGKSTLVNALVDHAVSIASPRPGTTRDFVEALDEIDGFPVLWIDTAGVRPTVDLLETAGIGASREAVRTADVLVLVLVSPAGELGAQIEAASHELGRPPDCVAISKCDLAAPNPTGTGAAAKTAMRVVTTSATTGTGLDELRAAVITAGRGDVADAALPACFAVGQGAWLRRSARDA